MAGSDPNISEQLGGSAFTVRVDDAGIYLKCHISGLILNVSISNKEFAQIYELLPPERRPGRVPIEIPEKETLMQILQALKDGKPQPHAIEAEPDVAAMDETNSSLLTLRRVRGWRRIIQGVDETCPRVGDKVYFAFTEIRLDERCFEKQKCHQAFGIGGIEADGCWMDYISQNTDVRNVTHWMPLPELPKLKGA